MPPPRRRREAGDRFRDAPSPIEVSRCNDDCGLDCAAGKRDLGAARQFSAVIAVTFPERATKQRVAVQRSNKLICGGLVSVGGTYRWRPMEDWTRSGVVGVPAASSSEKGTPLLDAASEAIATRILNGSIWGPTTEVAMAGCHGKLPINTDNRR